MNRLVTALLILLIPVLLKAQDTGNIRLRRLTLNADTIRFDTLSVVPGTFELFSEALGKLHDTLYVVDYPGALLITKGEFRAVHSGVHIRYRVFPLDFMAVTRNKVSDTLVNQGTDGDSPLFYRPVAVQNDFFGLGGLNSSGSISRGISAGNNQDAVVSASLNLQLSGKLTENLNIAAAVTDNNIPVQPEGTTAQIQEFDKVYIQVYNDRLKLTAGDFAVSEGRGYFMKFNKKAQGGLFEGHFESAEEEKKFIVNTALAGAVAKGRFERQTLSVIEGNQGPYKLKGSNNEIYIIVLAGSEKVYLDGMLLKRGQDNDYTIDYNTAEIIFMPRVMVSKDKRIVVEFEYADRNYARAVFYTGTTLKKPKLEAGFSFFSEGDLKNQPQNQELSDAQKQLLGAVGDSTAQAFWYGFDTVPFNSSFVMYKMVDSIVNGTTYDSVLVYSVSADSARYRPSFSNVGQGRGNYVQEQNVANGRVFRWVAPVGGVPQGNWEPVSLMIAPQKQQMFSFNLRYKPTSHTGAFAEVALSRKDLNTFSQLHNADNDGMALRTGIENELPLRSGSDKPLKLLSSATYEWVMKHFSTIERYRETEFERNWNAPSRQGHDEHLAGLALELKGAGSNSSAYSISSYNMPGAYAGVQNKIVITQDRGAYFLRAHVMHTSTNALTLRSSFLKYNTDAGRRQKWFTLGFKAAAERNGQRDKSSDTLNTGSFGHEQYEVYLRNPDTSEAVYTLFYRYRNDFYPVNNLFRLASKAEEAGITAALHRSQKQSLVLSGAMRKLYRISPTLALQGIRPDNNMASRIEYNGRFLKEALTLNTFVEMTTGLEVKNEYVFVEVPPGQGAYTWTDYNGNGIKELSEFEVALYADQASWIKVFVPTNQYVKAYARQFNQILNLSPALLWREAKGFKKLMTRFSEQFVFQFSHKNTDSAINPEDLFKNNVPDSNLLSLQATTRNTMSFNPQSPVWGADYIYNNNRSRMLLVNGFDSRLSSAHTLKARWNVLRRYFFTCTATSSLKSFDSEYLSNRDFRIISREAEPVAAYQPNSNVRISFIFKYTEKENAAAFPTEKALINLYGTEFRYSRLDKGNITGRVNFVAIRYNAATNTPLAYEMLDALQAGNNITWNLLYQKTLQNNMQLSFIYDGRKPGSNKVVHYGNVQIRAYF